MPSLTRDEAARRAELLHVSAYSIDLDLTRTGAADGFGSVTTVQFSCRQPGAETFVEIKCVELVEVTLNGQRVDEGRLDDNRLALTGLAADNELVVRATMAYSNTGEGLHHFTDPEDGSVYLYAQTFLDDAQRVFACFDQPDLKAPVTMSVSAPAGWEVAANGAGTQTVPGRWEFETTRPLATYFVSLIAGPYHVRRDRHDGIPLAVYCRRALAASLDKDIDEIFDVTKACLDRYHELFDVRYPFGKYDQAFVPEFNAGAMENAGLVTFRDEYVFRSAVADDDREDRAEVIAHEMAHMWFGDLVTMRWWDDLWLNESFAEYMAYRLTAEVTRFRGAWTGFVVGRKGWGYAADQRPSTHPVAPAEVADTDMALLNFDGISYAKGASVLRQLNVWLGDEVFLAGVRSHFAAHAFGNATLADLLGSLSGAAGRDLGGWSEVWLRQPQVNTLRPEVRVGADGRYESVEVVQSAPADHPVLRPHRIGVGVYRGGTRQQVMVTIAPDETGERTAVPELTGVEAGDLLLLNDDDLTYAKIRFDPSSLEALPTVLPGLTDPLARALVWAAVADAVRDGELPATDLVTLFEAAFESETEVSVMKDLQRVVTTRALDAKNPMTGVVSRFLPPDRLPAAEARIAGAFRRALESAAPGSGRQLVAARGLAYAATADEVTLMLAWLAGSRVPAGLAMDAQTRWTILTRLAILGAVSRPDIDEEAARDHTASGLEHAARCYAALPDADSKDRAWQIIMADDTRSNRLISAAAMGFWSPYHPELTDAYVSRYFEEAPGMAARRTPWLAIEVAEAAYPRFAVNPETVTRADELIARTDVTAGLRRSVIDYTDDLRRALAGRTLERS